MATKKLFIPARVGKRRKIHKILYKNSKIFACFQKSSSIYPKRGIKSLRFIPEICKADFLNRYKKNVGKKKCILEEWFFFFFNQNVIPKIQNIWHSSFFPLYILVILKRIIFYHSALMLADNYWLKFNKNWYNLYLQ